MDQSFLKNLSNLDIEKQSLNSAFEKCSSNYIERQKLILNNSLRKLNLTERIIYISKIITEFDFFEKEYSEWHSQQHPDYIDTSYEFAKIHSQFEGSLSEYEDNINEVIFELIGRQLEFKDFLGESIRKTIDGIYGVNNLDCFEILINNRKTILIDSNELFTISPYLYPFEVWKKIVKYDLSLKSEDELILSINKLFHLLSELEYRTGNNKVWDLWHEDELFIYRVEKDIFKWDIEAYKEYIKKITKINYSNLLKQELIDTLNKHEVRKKELYLKRIFKDKINLNISPKKVSLLIKTFFENNGFQINNERLRQIEKFVYDIFIFNEKYPFQPQADKTIDFFNAMIFDNFSHLLYFLDKTGIIELKSYISLTRLLQSELKYLDIGTERRKVFSEISLKDRNKLLKRSKLTLSTINGILPSPNRIILNKK
ncbi:hypothetical protein [Aquimarina algiphila]|uniref:hypothetical protein n=1 Tax=Aquimarina algiphila TaxID=2047982 RepID=UPI00249143CC|nr:hypothetical protein [Aquimarina algiphila]